MNIKHTLKYWKYEIWDGEWYEMIWYVYTMIYACEMKWKTREQAGCDKGERWDGSSDDYGMELPADGL